MTYSKQADFGTPASRAAEQVSLTIDGQSVTVPAGSTVMRAAAEIGTSIPKLCATDSLKQFGSCRLCLVEVDGARGTPASCPCRLPRAWSSTRKHPSCRSCARG